MRRRLDLAASLVGRPAVIFLDEPTTGLDPAKREDMWDVVRSLVADGSTVLLTTQYLEEADALADEITVIDHGRVIAHDTPDGLKRVVGGQRLTVRPADPARLDDLLDVLRGISGQAPEADGRGTVTVPVDGDDVLPDVVARLCAAGIAVEEWPPTGTPRSRPARHDWPGRRARTCTRWMAGRGGRPEPGPG